MTPLPLRLISAALLMGACLSSSAQYKVIGADGSVTYTDRPPTTPNAKVSRLGADARSAETAATAGDVALPFELRQTMARFPVTLYTAADCPPCDTGRQLLQQRGVPYTERRVATEDDAAALERLLGARTLPGLTVGSQTLRGLSETEWSGYLDAAGYPRESRLPRNWAAAPAAPLVTRVAVPRVAEAAAPASPAAPAPAAPVPATPSGVRF